MSDINGMRKDLNRRMNGAIEVLQQEFAGLRTGRASASLLEPVQVEAYGSTMPLNQVGSISVPEARMLSVQVWDKSMVKAVERAIMESGLGPESGCGRHVNSCTNPRTHRRTPPGTDEGRR